MEFQKFEINLVSACGLEAVRELDRMNVYAVASIADNKRTKRKTPVDHNNGVNPAWNFTIEYNIGVNAVQQEGVMLVVKLFCKRNLRADLYVGEFHASVRQLYEQAMANGGGTILTYNVQRGGAGSAGQFTLSCRLGEKVFVREQSFWRKLLARMAVHTIFDAVYSAVTGDPSGLDIPLFFDDVVDCA
ncbi:hypothetical protein NMG60_11035713 [Bertholletia excelsa]